MIPANKETQLPRGAAVIFFFAFISLFLAVGLRFEGVARARREHLERDVWPPVTATVERCSLEQYFTGNARRGAVYGIFCKFKYSVGGADYESFTRTIGQRHAFKSVGQLPLDAARMDAWARQHRKGSSQMVHYSPQNPKEVSLVGADDEFRTHTAAISLKASNQFAIFGAVLLLAALLARYISQRSAKT
jgi:hypothetical protein